MASKQRGTLVHGERKNDGVWRGRFRVKSGKRWREAWVTLGSDRDLSERQARAKLDEIVQKANEQRNVSRQFGIRGILREVARPSGVMENARSKRGYMRGDIAEISELLVVADLLSKGERVFRAASPTSPCDMVILRPEQTIRIEVKTAPRGSEPGKPVCLNLSAKEGQFDLLAVVHQNGQIEYIPAADLPVSTVVTTTEVVRDTCGMETENCGITGNSANQTILPVLFATRTYENVLP